MKTVWSFLFSHHNLWLLTLLPSSWVLVDWYFTISKIYHFLFWPLNIFVRVLLCSWFVAFFIFGNFRLRVTINGLLLCFGLRLFLQFLLLLYFVYHLDFLSQFLFCFKIYDSLHYSLSEFLPFLNARHKICIVFIQYRD